MSAEVTMHINGLVTVGEGSQGQCSRAVLHRLVERFNYCAVGVPVSFACGCLNVCLLTVLQVCRLELTALVGVNALDLVVRALLGCTDALNLGYH